MTTPTPHIVTSVIPHPSRGARAVSEPDRPTGSNGFLSRDQILEATHACFAEFGYDGTTIRAIAGRLGCSVGSIYRYFGDKRELLLACAESLFEPLLEGLRRRELSAVDGLRGYIEVAAEHDELYRLLFWLSASGERAGVPDVIQKLLDAWAAEFPDIRRQWATVHGLLMLNTPPHQIIAQLETPVRPAAEPVSDFAEEAEPQDVDVTLL